MNHTKLDNPLKLITFSLDQQKISSFYGFIPNEIFVQILSYLDQQSYRATALVCRKWNVWSEIARSQNKQSLLIYQTVLNMLESEIDSEPPNEYSNEFLADGIGYYKNQPVNFKESLNILNIFRHKLPNIKFLQNNSEDKRRKWSTVSDILNTVKIIDSSKSLGSIVNLVKIYKFYQKNTPFAEINEITGSYFREIIIHIIGRNLTFKSCNLEAAETFLSTMKAFPKSDWQRIYNEAMIFSCKKLSIFTADNLKDYPQKKRYSVIKNYKEPLFL